VTEGTSSRRSLSAGAWRGTKVHANSIILEVVGLHCTGNRSNIVATESIKSLFDDSHLFAVVILLVRAMLGTVLGIYAYLLLFDARKSS
jgi:hypothetical protein